MVAPGVSPQSRGTRPVLLALASMLVGLLAAALIGEGIFRVVGLQAEERGRIFRISDGPNLQFPGRAGHTVIDLYRSNPRGIFPVDLNDEATRRQLMAANFSRVEEARTTNPFGVTFRFNSRGYRDREFGPKAPATKRLVFVGDSFTEAQGVPEGLSAVRLVESLLRGQDPAIEVWNLGVRGRDFPEIESLFDDAFDLSPDAVIFGMILNDAERDAELTQKWPRVNDWIMVREETPSWLSLHSALFRFVSDRYGKLRVSRDTTAWYRALYSDDNLHGWRRTRAALQRIQGKCRDRGVGFGVALWPLLVGLEAGAVYPFEAAHAQIRRGVERSGIPFLDLLPTLRGRDSTALWVHPSDLHPNERAQALVAPVLTEFARLRLAEGSNERPVAK